MSFWSKKKKAPVESPVLVVDALGIAARIRSCGSRELVDLSQQLDNQYHGFRSKIPFRFVTVGRTSVTGSGEFGTFRLNDMFVLYATQPHPDAVHRHLVSTSLVYHSLLLHGFIPRGGMGYGLVLRSEDSLIGNGFVDAYEAAEKTRLPHIKNICAIHLSPSLFVRVGNSRMSNNLICYYEQSFFLNPHGLTDPDMGAFDSARILQLLDSAGANTEKLQATKKFLNELEDYKTAELPGSKFRMFLDSLSKEPPDSHGG